MEEGQLLTYQTLCQTARRAYQDSALTQTELADALGVSQSSVSQALSTPGPKFARLQRRVIERLTPFKVTEDVRFLLRRKAEGRDKPADRDELGGREA
jgi:predicted transcriptional regulator